MPCIEGKLQLGSEISGHVVHCQKISVCLFNYTVQYRIIREGMQSP